MNLIPKKPGFNNVEVTAEYVYIKVTFISI